MHAWPLVKSYSGKCFCLYMLTPSLRSFITNLCSSSWIWNERIWWTWFTVVAENSSQFLVLISRTSRWASFLWLGGNANQFNKLCFESHLTKAIFTIHLFSYGSIQFGSFKWIMNSPTLSNPIFPGNNLAYLRNILALRCTYTFLYMVEYWFLGNSRKLILLIKYLWWGII